MRVRVYDEAAREQKRRYYEANREQILARGRAWRAANPEKASALNKAWREANQEKHRANKQRWDEEHREEKRALQAMRDALLCDATVKGRYASRSGLSSADVPDEIVPLIRASMMIRREIRAKKKATP